jgi:metal-responsive CopG/Arc/MetJ family transcriptional regulator
MSKRITVIVDDELIERVDEYADDNRSETVRDLLQKGLKYDDEIKEKNKEIDQLNRKVSAIQSRREDVTELANYVEQERQLNREKQSASAVERLGWFLFGRDFDDD